jgi:acetolactate synthase-1/2/3 large subunit
MCADTLLTRIATNLKTKRRYSMKASDLFVKCLETEGVETIFGIPGEENADVMISLLDSSIEFVV